MGKPNVDILTQNVKKKLPPTIVKTSFAEQSRVKPKQPGKWEKKDVKTITFFQIRSTEII